MCTKYLDPYSQSIETSGEAIIKKKIMFINSKYYLWQRKSIRRMVKLYEKVEGQGCNQVSYTVYYSGPSNGCTRIVVRGCF